MRLICCFVLALCLVKVRSASISPRLVQSAENATCDTEEQAKNFVLQFDEQNSENSIAIRNANWNYESNLTDYNLQKMIDLMASTRQYEKEMYEKMLACPWETFEDEGLKSRFSRIDLNRTEMLTGMNRRLEEIKTEMTTLYGRAKICAFNGTETECNLSLEPELTELLQRSRNDSQQLEIWEGWREKFGPELMATYEEYVELSNQLARVAGYNDTSEQWIAGYGLDDFREQVDGLWLQLKPLYQQLHAYVRRHLRLRYGDAVVKATGPIPAHLLGNMWAQSWGNIADLMLPFPNATSAGNVTASLIEQGYTPLDMFKLSEQFYVSLNLSAMPDTFWQRSIIEKPADGRDLVCHASAWNFFDGDDFRIKMCTRVNEEDLYTVHHEMGHVQYYLQYKHFPEYWRGGANEAFHEAVGDVVALSVSTPKHMRAIGLLASVNASDEEAERRANVNHLFYMALEKVAFLPFAYELDKWRWGVFKNETTLDEYNCDWWALVHEYQGLEPPADRTREQFDIAAKYHIVADVPYIRYFVGFVIQFQIHKGLCQAAGQLDNDAPLNECDIYNSTQAGNLLGSMLQMGSSRPWQDAMEVVTGQREMDAGAIREYFAPLEEWLREENERTGELIGWEQPSHTCF